MLVLIHILLFLFLLFYNAPIVKGVAYGNWQLGFQDPATPIMEGIIYFNNQLMFLMILIACFVGWLLFQTIKLYSDFDSHWGVSVVSRNKKYPLRVYGKSTHSTMLEVIWTISPAALLMFIGLPSFSLLYSMDETVDPSITLKVVGHQWYWSYEYSDYVSQGVVEVTESTVPARFLGLECGDDESRSEYVNRLGIQMCEWYLDWRKKCVSVATNFTEEEKSAFRLMQLLRSAKVLGADADFKFGRLNNEFESQKSILLGLLKSEDTRSYLKDVTISHLEKSVSTIQSGIPMVAKGIKFDSYLVPEEDLAIPKPYGTGKVGKVLRLLEVDNRVVLPIYTHIRVLVTGADVLHSWAIPSLGVKVDSCPGRLNQIFLFLKRDGVFYGQCSEICGVNHGFMPIVVKGVALEEYSVWVSQRLKNC